MSDNQNIFGQSEFPRTLQSIRSLNAEERAAVRLAMVLAGISMTSLFAVLAMSLAGPQLGERMASVWAFISKVV